MLFIKNNFKAVKATAEHLRINVRWGGDFKSFRDAPHWELV